MASPAARPAPNASVRRVLSALLPTDPDFSAFCLDYFPAVYRNFSGAMPRIERTNLLLLMQSPQDVVQALRVQFPEQADELARIDAEVASAARLSEPPSPEDSARLPPRDSAPSSAPELLDRLAELTSKQQRLLQSNQDTARVDVQLAEVKRQLRRGHSLQKKELLAERYELLEPVGAGGFSQVWRAWDLRRKRTVAIKVLHSRLGENRMLRDRFLRGGRKMAELRHPHIVEVLDPPEQCDGFYFFVMELMSGGDLRAAVLHRQQSREQAMTCVLEAGKALQYAHQRGLIHRDVKPANILLTEQGVAKVSDFDLVRARDTFGETRDGQAMGTFLYAAPEALSDGAKVDQRTDIFSLGMTALFVLRGQELPLLAFKNTDQFIDSLDIGELLKEVLKRATASEARHRQPTMNRFCAELNAALVGERLPPWRQPWSERLLQRAPWVGGLGIAGALGYAVSGLPGAWRSPDPGVQARIQTVRAAAAAPGPDAVAMSLPEPKASAPAAPRPPPDVGTGEITAAPVKPPAPQPGPPPKPSAKPGSLILGLFSKKPIDRGTALGQLEEGRLANAGGNSAGAYDICRSAGSNPDLRGLALVCMGEAEFRRRQYKEAARLGKLAIAERAAGKDVYLLLGRASMMMRRCPDAKVWFSKVINGSDPANPEALKGLELCR